MAVITETSGKVAGSFAPTRTTLSSSDTLVYDSAKNQFLIVENPTGGSLTLNIDGSGSTTIAVPGYGGTVSVASGYNITVAAGAVAAVNLNTINAFLLGTVTCTGASGATAMIINVL